MRTLTIFASTLFLTFNFARAQSSCAGYALDFNGDGQDVAVGTFSSGSELTVEAWVNAAGSTGTIQAAVSSQTNAELIHLQVAGASTAYTDNGTISFSTVPLAMVT